MAHITLTFAETLNINNSIDNAIKEYNLWVTPKTRNKFVGLVNRLNKCVYTSDLVDGYTLFNFGFYKENGKNIDYIEMAKTRPVNRPIGLVFRLEIQGKNYSLLRYNDNEIISVQNFDKWMPLKKILNSIIVG